MAYALKLVWMSVSLLFSLLLLARWRTDVLLVQNPPGVPALAVCWLVARMKRARLVVDWHNYSYSILQHQFTMGVDGQATGGKTKVLTGFRKRLVGWLEAGERRWGAGGGDVHLCVTHAMRADLLRRWGVRAVTLYDRPPAWRFAGAPLTDRQKHVFFRRMAEQKLYTAFWTTPERIDADRTCMSYCVNGEARLADDRPALLVSSTSWTPDEDFGLLLDALTRYDARAHADATDNGGARRLPSVLAVITGKGPLKEHYLDAIARLRLRRVTFLTPWLDAADYPTMLRAADLGVCLHTSTSGLHLPMKVVDMFGCGLPVLAKAYGCLDELPNDGDNGRAFDDADHLARLLADTLAHFPHGAHVLDEYKSHLRSQPMISWEDNWEATVWPLFQHMYSS